jgi:PhoPQ-activated pathogenicity-related protein
VSELKKWKVKRVHRSDVRDFIERHHYSKSINGCIADYCYALYNTADVMVGAMFYGRFAMANQYKRFSDCIEDVIELRRLCCIDDTPKNTESYFIGKSLKLLKQDWGGKIVVSYSDIEYNHTGTIYKASNFEQLESIKGARVIISNGKKYHDKAIRAYHNGKLKPFAIKLREQLDEGIAYYKKTKGKNTFAYYL